MARVIVVDDDEAFRQRVAELIAASPDFSVCAAVGSLDEARALIGVLEFDVLLVDLGLPDGNGVDLIRAVTARRPSVDVMVVTVFGDESHVLASIEAGASGYVLKRALADTLLATLRELRGGGSPISPIIARQLLQRFRARPEQPVAADPDDHDLSERERDVLTYISKGFSVPEIAQMLGISAHTVATYVKRIYRKLAVHSRTEALYEAGRLGLL